MKNSKVVTDGVINTIADAVRGYQRNRKGPKMIIDRKACKAILNSNMYKRVIYYPSKHYRNEVYLKPTGMGHYIHASGHLGSNPGYVYGLRCRGEGAGSMFNFLGHKIKYLSEFLTNYPAFERYYR